MPWQEPFGVPSAVVVSRAGPVTEWSVIGQSL